MTKHSKPLGPPPWLKRKKSKPPKLNRRDEYDFRTGMRGQYVNRFGPGTNVVVLAPDVAKRFPDSESANEALREAMRAKGPRKTPT